MNEGNMKNLIIIGAGGLGRSVCTLFSNQSNYKQMYVVKGFLDDNVDALLGFDGYPPVIGMIDNYDIQEDDVFFCALGDIHDRNESVNKILAHGGKFVSCVSEYALVNPMAKIGQGVFINAFSSIDANVEICDFSYVFTYCSIGHDTSIGEFCQIEPFCAIGGHVVLHDRVTLHPHSTVLPRLKIGNDASVGVGSVVMRNVDDKQVVFGNPAVSLKI